MKKSLLWTAIIIMATIAMTGCGVINHGNCRMPHYPNQTQRNSRYFAGDTLNLAQLADKYTQLIEGDTIVVRGCFVQGERHTWGTAPPHGFTMYLHDCSEDFEPSDGYWGVSGHVQFFATRELLLYGINEIDSIANDTWVVVTGIIHFSFFDPGPGPDYCEEQSFLEVLELTEKEEG